MEEDDVVCTSRSETDQMVADWTPQRLCLQSASNIQKLWNTWCHRCNNRLRGGVICRIVLILTCWVMVIHGDSWREIWKGQTRWRQTTLVVRNCCSQYRRTNRVTHQCCNIQNTAKYMFLWKAQYVPWRWQMNGIFHKSPCVFIVLKVTLVLLFDFLVITGWIDVIHVERILNSSHSIWGL